MDHILTKCLIPEQNLIWKLAEALWKGKGYSWPEVRNIGSVLRCSLADFKSGDEERDPGANRLYRILVSESAHLIWRLRCTRVIELGWDEESWPSPFDIAGRWKAMVERRFTLDCAMTNPKWESDALDRDLVLSTWRGLLVDEASLPDDWLSSPTGGLVGIRFPEWAEVGWDPP